MGGTIMPDIAVIRRGEGGEREREKSYFSAF